MAQPFSAEKGNKPFLHLTYSIPGLRAQKDFAFHSGSTILTGVQLSSQLRNVCKFGQGHMKRLQDTQNVPELFPNSIFALAHQDPKSEPDENNVSPWLQQGALDMSQIIVFSSSGFITNSINFNSKYLMFEVWVMDVVFFGGGERGWWFGVFFNTRGKVSAKKEKEQRRLHFLFNFLPLALLQNQS